MKNRKLLAGIVLGLVCALGGSYSAMAATSSTRFDGVLNRAQQSRYFAWQTKSYNNVPSNIIFDSIGGGYLANVKSQHANGTQYTELKGLGVNYGYQIANGTPANIQTRLIVTNYSWSTVTVSINGTYVTF